MEQVPQIIDSARVFEGRVFNVRVDRVRYADGAEHRLDVVEHPGSVVILATPAPEQIVLVRQYRHPAGRLLWELPAGTAEPGTSGRRSRARAGRGNRVPGRPDSIDRLAFHDAGLLRRDHDFYAEDLQAGPQSLDDDERIEVTTFTREAAWRLVASGDIADVKTVLALLWMPSGQGEIGTGFGR